MWAPGMNLHRTPFNSRNHEYYSEDPIITNILGSAFVRGGLEKGAILSAKHFAFNSQESYREGLVQFMEEQSARELELRAYQGLSEDIKYINSSGNEISALGLMSSFSRIGVCGVNAHTGLMKNILRGEWGFKGLISTDMVVGGYFFNPQDSVINNVTFMATSNAENLLNSYWSNYNNKNLVKSDPNMLTALYQNMHYYPQKTDGSRRLFLYTFRY
jgi:beta-glucosidase